MASVMRGLISSNLRRGAVRAFSSQSSGAVRPVCASIPRTLLTSAGAGAVLYGVTLPFYMDSFPRFTSAKCETRIDEEAEDFPVVVVEDVADAADSSADGAAAGAAAAIKSRADELYSSGRLAEVYELLNENPATKDNAALLYRLAQTTHKLSMATPQPERRRVLNDEALLIVMKAAEEAGKREDNKSDRADILALYGTVIQYRSHRKEGAARKQLRTLAQEHMTAALREDAVNFNANVALADLHYELAQERTELGRQSLTGIAIFDKTNNNKLSETDQESLWRATARHAYVALKAQPNDINCINYMAQSKFAIGDLATAKTYTLRAMAAEKEAKFADEKKSAKESKDLMDKINIILGERS